MASYWAGVSWPTAVNTIVTRWSIAGVTTGVGVGPDVAEPPGLRTGVLKSIRDGFGLPKSCPPASEVTARK